MELLCAINMSPISIFEDINNTIFCASSKDNSQNPNLILKAYAIKEMTGGILFVMKNFYNKTMLVEKTGVLTKKRKGA
ncbi:MAG: hypothetical protein M3139_09605 [Bacteroidota bacterium]|nr:hypothetical protein [Bacteroidota bacterium]